jgi:redox-sensitive bicupin YhaK (pirin superfamily)
MGSGRKISRVQRGKPTIEGAGVHLKRVFGFHDTPLFDPFLLLDEFGSDNHSDYIAGFPWHPHRGIETITYVLEGSVEHGDSLGNAGVIHAGDVQWMTAGSGIIHQEMPRGNDAGRLRGIQLWANLPASHKMMDPRYRDVKATDIPEVAGAGGVIVKVICGEWDGVRGPAADIVIDPRYLDVFVPPETTADFPVAAGRRVFAYVLDGRARFQQDADAFAYDVEGANYFDFDRDCMTGASSAVMFGDGGDVTVSTAGDPVRFLLVSGEPLGEPIAWGGPIVMNTREELRQAFEDYKRGSFLRRERL